VKNADSLASEMAALANSEGGKIFIGVDENGSTPGLSREDIGRINQLISNAASHLVRSPLTVQTTNVPVRPGRVVIVLNVPKGMDKPYFDNRIEIISPGHLPNNLNVEKMRAGISNIRNPILVSFVAKGLLPYHGLGSGIKRAIEGWPDIDFIDDREGCLFTVTVHRKEHAVPQKSSGKSSGKTEHQVLSFLAERPEMTIPQLAEALDITTRGVEKQIAKLRREGHLRRVGPAKGGYWEIVETENG
jgi:predicted HTH transcriptional regulator